MTPQRAPLLTGCASEDRGRVVRFVDPCCPATSIVISGGAGVRVQLCSLPLVRAALGGLRWKRQCWRRGFCPSFLADGSVDNLCSVYIPAFLDTFQVGQRCFLFWCGCDLAHGGAITAHCPGQPVPAPAGAKGPRSDALKAEAAPAAVPALFCPSIPRPTPGRGASSAFMLSDVVVSSLAASRASNTGCKCPTARPLNHPQKRPPVERLDAPNHQTALSSPLT